jgi:hypothetical protein
MNPVPHATKKFNHVARSRLNVDHGVTAVQRDGAVEQPLLVLL